jgi:hypothetical protein
LSIASGFRKSGRLYGLQIVPLQFVVPGPSARATFGITTAFKKNTAAANTSNMRFIVVFLLVPQSGR